MYEQVASLWKSFLPTDHHLAGADVKVLEESKPADITFRYVNILEDGDLIGIMYLQLLRFNSRHYDAGVLDRPYLKPLKGLITQKTARILICGNLFRVKFQGFYFREKKRRDMVFSCLLEYRKTELKKERVSGILVKDCSREFSAIQFGCHSFRSFKQDLTMELTLRPEWQTFEDYTNSLTRKYKQRAKKIVTAANDIDVRDLELNDITSQHDRIRQLYMNVVQQQSLALGILNATYFETMKAGLGERFKVFGYFLDGKMLAFSSHIYYPPKNCMEIHYIGMDYDANSKYHLYFNILFHGIKTAIAQRVDTIEMGRTAREAKASAGAQPVENYNYIWVRPGIISLAVNFLGKRFEGKVGDEWRKRQPFREDPRNEASPG